MKKAGSFLHRLQKLPDLCLSCDDRSGCRNHQQRMISGHIGIPFFTIRRSLPMSA